MVTTTHIPTGTEINGWKVTKRLGTTHDGDCAYEIRCPACDLVRTTTRTALIAKSVAPCPHPSLSHCDNDIGDDDDGRTILDPRLHPRLWRRMY